VGKWEMDVEILWGQYNTLTP